MARILISHLMLVKAERLLLPPGVTSSEWRSPLVLYEQLPADPMRVPDHPCRLWAFCSAVFYPQRDSLQRDSFSADSGRSSTK